jgi:FMN-dependent NADH-azoreductase
MTNTVLQLDSSAQRSESITREVTEYLAKELSAQLDTNIVHRDLNHTELPLVTQEHIGAYYTRPDERSDEQRALLTGSDELIAELKQARRLVIGAPMYNFSVPAALKAWIDQICRVGETFVYGDNGPQGLLDIEEAYIVVSTGGTPVGSPADFTSAYLQQVCRFIGIETAHIINASGSKRNPQEAIDNAKAQIDQLLDIELVS